MKKQLTALIIVVAIFFSMFPITTYAFDRDEHDKYLEEVLFGDSSFKHSQTEKVKNKIMMLEDASYLSIDQCQGKGLKQLEFLKKQKVKGLPKLEEFDLTGINSSKHRSYTHRGWDYVYVKQEDKANWPVRKALLCSTVNKVFDFGFKQELFGNVCEQCNSFSAMVYYVHILGDQIERKQYKAEEAIMPLARPHAGDGNEDLFWEVKKHSEVLFASQKKTATYTSFMQELESLASKARTLAGTKNGINETNFTQYHEYAEDFMKLLISYIPLLLENEEFFNNEFY